MKNGTGGMPPPGQTENVDGEWLGTFDFEPFEPSGVLRRGSIVTYAAPDTKQNKKADHAATIDNFAIEVVSE